jgi:hypothetical protein
MRHLRLLALGAFAGVALLYSLERWNGSIDRAEIASLTAWLSSAGHHIAAKRDTLQTQVVTATRWRTAWDTVIRVDTLWATDTVRIPVQVLLVADSAIRSCAIALTTCQELAALERARADSAERLAQLWHHVARGPFLRPSAELLFAGSHPRAAAQLEAGRRLSAVARLEVDTLPRLWAGLRYQF